MLAGEVVHEVARRGGASPDPAKVKDILVKVGHEIDLLAGRSFSPVRQRSSIFEPNGLPFVDVPDAQVGSLEISTGPWPIPDSVNRQLATVLQVASLADPVPRAVRVAEALWVAGQLLAEASRTGRLSGDYVLYWLGSIDREQRADIMRRVMDPAVRYSVPILGVAVEGWWIQLSRRLVWVTTETEDEGRLFELLLNGKMSGEPASPLAACEPVLIVARMTEQPADWAFTARIWTEAVERGMDRPWAKIAPAIRSHGIPTITLDPVSTSFELACQVVLKGYWHGYIGGDDPALANAVAMAYPQQIEQIRRAMSAPNSLFAAATLLGQLVHPGFDPARGAESTRRYVRRMANIAIKEYRKAETPDRYPWTQVGISERRYYKLLPQFASKVNGRYDLDQEEVVARMKAHISQVDQARNVRSEVLNVLMSNGFSEAAARKWMQRHSPEEAINARPRSHRTGSAEPDPV
jgi:hypothetical protein